MAKGKNVELPTADQVALFIETYIPDPLATSFGALMNQLVNLQSVEVDTGDEDEAPARGRGNGKASSRRASSDDLLNDDDLLGNEEGGNEDEGEDEPAPRRGRGRAADVNEDDDPAPRRRGRQAEAENEDDDPAPRRRGRAAEANEDDEPAPRRGGPGRGRRAEPEEEENEGGEAAVVTFDDLGLDKKTVKEYEEAYGDYKAKDIKGEITDSFGITLKGNDLDDLAARGARVYAAMETLTALPLKRIEKKVNDLGLEVDYGRSKSEKSRIQTAARALVEAALESYEA